MASFAYLNQPVPNVMAHRGGGRGEAEADNGPSTTPDDAKPPENTMAAFARAVELGYHYLETDVHLSADGILVAFHDDDLERVTGRPGRIADLTWAELEAIDLGDGQSIPSMRQLLDAFPRARFNIDPKADEAVDPLIALITETDAVDRVGIGSFSEDRIRRVRAGLGPSICTSPGRTGVIKLLLAAYLWPRLNHGYGCIQIPPSSGVLRLDGAGLIRRWHRMGLQVHYWTINEAAEMERLLDRGADMIITDEIELALDVLARHS